MKTKYIDDAFMISFPKAGRTWLRVMFAKLLEMGGGNPKKLELIRYRHDGADVQKYKQKKQRWKDSRVILLIRDPRDVIVSFYFQITLREKKKWNYTKSISKFIRDDRFGIKNIVDFYNFWWENKKVPKDFLLVKYEHLKIDPQWELMAMCQFLNIWDEIRDLDLNKVIQYSSFDSMKEMDHGKKDHLLSNKGGFNISGTDPERFKVRKGRVGGYVEYLSDLDIKYVTNQVHTRLSPLFGYHLETK